MRKIVVTEFLSLDGVMENPAWTAPFWNDDIAKFKSEESYATDALLLGRVTYQGFAAAWPESEDEGAMVPLVLMIHKATNGQITAALKRIDALDCVKKPPRMIRVEHFS